MAPASRASRQSHETASLMENLNNKDRELQEQRRICEMLRQEEILHELIHTHPDSSYITYLEIH